MAFNASRVAAACVALAVFAVPHLASASVTYTVNSTVDLPDVDASDGLCRTSAGTCTVRAAIMQSNANPADAPLIIVPAGHYTITRPQDGSGTSGFFSLRTPSPATDAVTTIRGAGAATTTIDGGGTESLFAVNQDRHVDFGGVTLTHGAATLANGTAGAGGVLFNSGVLTIHDSVLSDSSALAIGGCIYSSGYLTLDRVEVRGCTAGQAGGLSFHSGNLTIDDSSFAFNSAGSIGGGIVAENSTVAITNTTLFANSATGNGGGFYWAGGAGSATLFNTTIAFNTIDSDFDGNGTGGGLYATARLDLYNSLVSGNTPPDAPTWDDCVGPVHTYGENILGGTPSCQDSDCTPTGVEGCAVTVESGHNGLLNSVFMLGSYANHGGATPTLALLAGSNAIDYGGFTCEGNGPVITRDQRGYPRPVGERCDAGAYEYQGADVIFANGFE